MIAQIVHLSICWWSVLSGPETLRFHANGTLLLLKAMNANANSKGRCKL